MLHRGSCHCGKIAFEVEADVREVVDCNCSMCRRRGGLLFFVGRDKLKLLTDAADVATYGFGKKHIQHHFCTRCGIAPYSEGTNPSGSPMAAINARCVEGLDLAALKVNAFDGASM